MNLAPYRPKSLDELNQAYDKAKEAERASRQPAAPQPQQPAVSPQAPQTPQPQRSSIADAVRARENTQALSGAVDDFIKDFSAKETAPQSAFTRAKETTEAKKTQAQQEIARETQQAFDDILSFPDFQTKPPEPPVYQRYTHEEAPIKEGDLSGLMDEYIAVMTDQNGEDEARHSFLRRRKNRKKDKLPQHSDTEPAADLFDLPTPPPASVETPPLDLPFEAPPAPTTLPFETPVAPTRLPAEEPVAPTVLPVEEPAAPVAEPDLPLDLLFETPDVPVETPAEAPAVPAEPPVEAPEAPFELPFETPDVPVETPVEAPAVSAEPPVEVPEAPLELPFEDPATPIDLLFEEPAMPIEVPAEKPAAPVAIPVEEPAIPVEIPVEEPAVPVELPAEEPDIPVGIPVEAPVLPAEEPDIPVALPAEEPAVPAEPPVAKADAPVVPHMPAYMPYQSPMANRQPDTTAAPPAATAAKPKHKINMEPEPVFDPHRLFDDLEDNTSDEPAPQPLEVPPAAEVPAESGFAAPPLFPDNAAPAVQPDTSFDAPLPVTDSIEPAPAPQPVPQSFEDIVSYSTETKNDRFTPAPEPPFAAPQAPAEPSQPDDDEIDYDEFAATELQQEVVIRPSKVKIFLKVLVTLLMIVSLLATACIGAIKLVLNVNKAKSAFGDYYFFTVTKDFASVGISNGDLVIAKYKLPLDPGDIAVYINSISSYFQTGGRSFSFGKYDASSSNAAVYNLSGNAVQEGDLRGVVIKIIPKVGTVVTELLNEEKKTFKISLIACAGSFCLLLLIRVIFLRKKRRYMTVEELAQRSTSGKAPNKKKAKKEKPAKAEKAKKAKKQTASPPPPPDDDLFSDIG